MNTQPSLTRRRFIKRALSLGSGIFLINLFPTCITHQSNTAEINMEEFLSSIKDLSLKEMAEKKIHHGKDHFFNPFNPKGHAGFSRVLPCNHWTMRNPILGPNGSLWGAFLIKGASGVNIFISGDTAYFDRFKELGESYSIDPAIISLGAYEPRWMMANSHMNPAEAVKAFRELKARHLVIVHWGSFRLGDEPVYLPSLDVKTEMEKQGILAQLIHLEHGQTLFYDGLKVV